jgi:L-seryl-tRNA(Ser) seleniumtransferase
MRALRVDKLTLAAMEATLEIHLEGNTAQELPVIEMLSANAEQVRQRCLRVIEQLGKPREVEIVSCLSQIGGGSVPGSELPSYGLQLKSNEPDRLANSLRQGLPAVQSRIHQDCLLLDLRTVSDDQCADLAKRLRQVLEQERSEERAG